MRNKMNERKVYSLLLESREASFLSVQFAKSLEEAFLLAKLEYEKINKDMVGILNPLIGAKISLFTIKTVAELRDTPDPLAQLVSEKEPPVASNPTLIPPHVKKEVPTDKNTLMQKIIATKDATLFRTSMKLFSAAERKYIRSQLK